MPSYGLILMFISNTYLSYFPLDIKIKLFLLIFAGTFFLPVLFMPILLYAKFIKKMEMKTRRERIYPLLLTLIMFYITYYFITQLPLPLIFNKYLFAATISVAVSLIVTLFWKISLHLIGVGGLLALAVSMSLKFTADFRFFFIAIILISGIVAFARLFLKSHSSLQIYLGFLTGFLLVFTIMTTF